MSSPSGIATNSDVTDEVVFSGVPVSNDQDCQSFPRNQTISFVNIGRIARLTYRQDNS